MSSFFRNIFSRPAFWHILIVLGLIALTLLGQRKSVSDAESIADKWIEKIKIEDPDKMVTLPFITKDGWDKANQYSKTVFITAAALTAYFGAFPPVFQQSQNIADNKKLYLQYVALHDEVMSYLSLQQPTDGKQAKVFEFILYIDKQLTQLNTVAIGFDDTKVPNYKGAFDKL